MSDLHCLATFAIMLGSALTISELALRLRFYGDAVRERRTAELYAMSHELVPTMTVGELVSVITRHLRQGSASRGSGQARVRSGAAARLRDG